MKTIKIAVVLTRVIKPKSAKWELELGMSVVVNSKGEPHTFKRRPKGYSRIGFISMIIEGNLCQVRISNPAL